MFNSKRLIVATTCLTLLVAACGTNGGSPTTNAVDSATTTMANEESSSTTAESPGIVPGENADADAIVEVYRVVFDSTTTFEEKSALIDDASGLEDTVATYETTGATVGGVTAEPTAVTVDGDSADVVYTLFFSGNPTYPNQSGTAIFTDNGWQITREMFCNVMASARSACPTG